MQHDIMSINDIERLVNRFYDKVRTDNLLGPIFNERIGNGWPEHLAKMYRFWQTILLGEHTYNGSPFPPHAKLPVGPEHFSQWMALFERTVDELFSGALAADAKHRAGKMAALFQVKIAHHQKTGINNLL